MEIKIKCPKCKWEPTIKSRWTCTCGHVWNTFDTAGHCPKCGRAWRKTQCPACQSWSIHTRWYSGFDTILDDVYKILNKKPVKTKRRSS